MAGHKRHDRLLAGRYRLLERPGRGGPGPVWWGRDELLGRAVAVKEVYVPPWLTDDQRRLFTQRTVRRARLAARLSHPNVVAILAAVEHDDRPWIVLEWLPCQSVAHVLTAHGPLRPGQAAGVGVMVARALAAAHWDGILHGAVKPSNVLLVDDGSVALTGFATGTAEGGYLTPEAARGRPTGAASDRWLLGATLYTAVEGRPPYQRPDAAALRAALTTQDPDPPLFAGPLWPVLHGLLRPDPAERLTTAETELLLGEVAAAAGVPVEERPFAGRPPALPVRRPRVDTGRDADAAQPPLRPTETLAGVGAGRVDVSGDRQRSRRTMAAAVLALVMAAGTVVGWTVWTGEDHRRPGVVADGERPEPPWHVTPPWQLPPDAGDDPGADDAADGGVEGDAPAGDRPGDGGDRGGDDGGDGDDGDDDGGDDGDDDGGDRDRPGQRNLRGEGALSSPDSARALGDGAGRGRVRGSENGNGAGRWGTDGHWTGTAAGGDRGSTGRRDGRAARTLGDRGASNARGVSNARGAWRAEGTFNAQGKWRAAGRWDSRGSGATQRDWTHHGRWSVRGDRSGIRHVKVQVTDGRRGVDA